MAKSRTRAKRKKYRPVEGSKDLKWSKRKSLGLVIILLILATLVVAVVVGLIILSKRI